MRHRYAICCTVLLVTLGHIVALAQTEAILGQPFGVGCIVLPISPGELSATRGLEDVQIYEQNNRVLYPVFEVREVPREVTQAFQNARRPIGRLVGEILDQTGTSIAVYFLFTGNTAPLNVTIVTNRSVTRTVTPVQRPARYNPLLQEWWGKYNKELEEKARIGKAQGHTIVPRYGRTEFDRSYLPDADVVKFSRAMPFRRRSKRRRRQRRR